MSITVVPSVITGQSYSAANYNTQVRDNINGIWVLTTAGDMLYATGASAANRLALVVGGVMYGGASAPAWLAKPTVDSLFTNSSSGVPAYLGKTLLPGIVHASGQVDQGTQQGPYSSTSYQDVGGVTLDLILTTTCTVFAFAYGAQSNNAATQYPYYGITIGGTDDTLNIQSGFAIPNMFISARRKTGIAAGTCTVKLRVKMAGAGDDVSIRQARLVAWAIPE